MKKFHYKKALGSVWREKHPKTIDDLRDGLERYYAIEGKIHATKDALKIKQRRQGQWQDGYQAMGAASEDKGKGGGKKGDKEHERSQSAPPAAPRR